MRSSSKDNSKRSTGISGLDYTLDGGILSGTSTVVIGSPISGLDLLARQFWKTEDEQGSYLMLDADAEEGMDPVHDLPPDRLPERMKGDRIVVDSLSSLVLTYGIDAAIRFMSDGIRDTLARRATVLFVVYSGLHAPAEEIRIIRAADNVIELRQEVRGNEVIRTLALYKLKGAAVPDRVVPFIITEKGIELSTTSRVV